MYRKYKKPITNVFPDVRVPEPKVSKLVLFIVRVLGRIYLFLFYGIARMGFKDGPVLFNAFKRALSGESRCIIAFRHPNGGEPQLLSWLFLFKLKRYAARAGIRLSRNPHAIFVYGYEVARWGGGIVRFIMPNLGALPIHHSKIDRQGMNRIFKAITEGPFPLALAPEGQVSYTTDGVPRLEPGAIRIGFSAAERLAESKPGCSVEILPVSVYFRFGAWGKLTMEMLLKKIEKFSGFSQQDREGLSLTERIQKCRDYILEVNEEHYQIVSDTSLSFGERLDKVITAALETAERMLGLKPEGEFFSRMYRIRQYCWDRIFLPDVESFEEMSQIERNARDLQAGEAWYIGRHQEIVDFCWYFRGPLPTEETALHNKIEYVQNLWDFASRTMGGAYADRVSIFPRKVIVQASPVINLSARLPSYKKDRNAAIDTAMSDLEKAYLDCIDGANKTTSRIEGD